MSIGTEYEGLVISKGFTEQMELEREKSLLKYEILEGKTVEMEISDEFLNLPIRKPQFRIAIYKIDWIAYVSIQENSWLSEFNAVIDWNLNLILLQGRNEYNVLNAKALYQEG